MHFGVCYAFMNYFIFLLYIIGNIKIFCSISVSVGLFSKSLAEDCLECQPLCGSAGVIDCATCLCQPSCEVSN